MKHSASQIVVPPLVLSVTGNAHQHAQPRLQHPLLLSHCGCTHFRRAFRNKFHSLPCTEKRHGASRFPEVYREDQTRSHWAASAPLNTSPSGLTCKNQVLIPQYTHQALVEQYQVECARSKMWNDCIHSHKCKAMVPLACKIRFIDSLATHPVHKL